MLDKTRSVFLLRPQSSRYQTVVNELVIPQTRIISDEAVIVFRGIDGFRVKLVNDLRCRSNMIAVRMRADVEIEVVLRHADLLHIGNDLVFLSHALRGARAHGIAEIRAVRREGVFTRINYAKMTVTFHYDRIHIIEGKHMDADVS